MVKRSKAIAYLGLFVAVVAAIAASGCTGSNAPAATLSGKDIFDPAKFSMARYDMVLNESGNLAHHEFIVTAARGEKDGDRITSHEIYGGNESIRTDVWINRQRTASTNVVITAINSSTIVVTGGYPPFNMTTADEAWNSLDATYSLIASTSVNTTAGHFDNCSVYAAEHQVGYGDTFVTTKIYYYMHPSEPVPVRYIVETPSATYTYDLVSAYGPNDVDSTPERVVQAFFDSLEQGDNETASGYVVTYDSTSNRFKPLSGEVYQEFLQGVGTMYGESANATKVQYVLITPTGEAQQIGGRDVITVRWTSVQYQYSPLSVFELNGKLNIVNINGHWKIVG